MSTCQAFELSGDSACNSDEPAMQFMHTIRYGRWGMTSYPDPRAQHKTEGQGLCSRA